MKRRGVGELEEGEESMEARSFVDVARAHPFAIQIRPLTPFRDLTGIGWGCVFAYRMQPRVEPVRAKHARENKALERATLQIEMENQEAVVEVPFKITDYLQITAHES